MSKYCTKYRLLKKTIIFVTKEMISYILMLGKTIVSEPIDVEEVAVRKNNFFYGN